jgi:cytochrome c-type biogenesis protein CcmH
MLARSYKVMRRPEEAIRAFEKARSLVEQDPQLLADYADLLASNAGGNLDGRPEELVNMALKLDPNHMQSLWLAGTAAFNRNDFGKAAEIWERALAQLPPGSEDAKMLAGVIAEARDKGGIKKAPAAGAAVSGRVELAANLKTQAAPSDTVFILARGEGAPMPLAVLRVRVADLPMNFRLDDSNAVMPTKTISSAKSVRVEARVAKGGDAQSKPGDLSGTSGLVKPGAKNLRIKIDTVVQ